MLLWLVSNPAAAEDWTLRDAVAHALAHNVELRQAVLDTETAEASLVETRAGWGPSLAAAAGVASVAAGGEVEGGLGWSVGVSQPLPTGGTVWVGGSQDQAIARQLADASVSSFTGVTVDQPVLEGAWGAAGYARAQGVFAAEGARLRERDAREGLVVEVANAYWELVAARERERLAVRSVEIAEQQLEDTRERFAEGFAGSGDVLQLERALGVAKQSRVVADAAESSSERALMRQIGVPLAEARPLNLVDRPDPKVLDLSFEASLARARTANVSWLLAQLALASAKRDLAANRNNALPDLSVSGSVGLTEDAGVVDTFGPSATQSWALGASLSVPLAWSGTVAGLRSGDLTMQRAQLDAEAAWEDLQGQVASALQAVERDQLRVALAEATLQAAQAGLDADQDLYREGRGSTRDVVRSLESLEEAQVAGLTAQIDLQSSLLTLARLEGRVLE